MQFISNGNELHELQHQCGEDQHVIIEIDVLVDVPDVPEIDVLDTSSSQVRKPSIALNRDRI